MTAVHELELIAFAARGAFEAEHLERIRATSFATDAALFAWTCAARACRMLGPLLREHAARTGAGCFFAVQWMRVTAPRLDMPLEAWAALHRDTDAVIDAAETFDRDRKGRVT